MLIFGNTVASRYDQFADILSCHNDETDAHKDPVYYVAMWVDKNNTFPAAYYINYGNADSCKN